MYRSCSDRAVKLEASVETYRRKLEDLGDLRRQVKLLEEKNMTYMHNTVSLEEELRKANTARAQLETYKRQVRYTRDRIIPEVVPSLLHYRSDSAGLGKTWRNSEAFALTYQVVSEETSFWKDKKPIRGLTKAISCFLPGPGAAPEVVRGVSAGR